MNSKNRLHRLIGFAMVLLMAVPTIALAEDDQPSEMTREFDKYWAKRRQVRNIHKRLFLKDGRHEISIVGGVIPNDDFFVYYPMGVRYDWYVTEDLAIEVDGSYIVETKTDLKKFLETEITGGVVNLPQVLEYQTGVGLMWTPLHGKVGAFSTYLGHFDFGIKLGVMAIGTKVATDSGAAAKRRIDVGGNAGATVRLYFLDFMAIRIDYRHYFYAARNTNDDIRGLSFPAEISMGLSLFTSAPK